jgi:aconitate hydratase
MNPEENRIIQFYNNLSGEIARIRKVLNQPLTLSEKILYIHCICMPELKLQLRGIDYALFAPDRVAMQDATAQMALLQFMLAGKDTSVVPASIHCDHLITARKGASA